MSYTKVLASDVTIACDNFVEAINKKKKEDLEKLIASAMKRNWPWRWWSRTREQVIKDANNDSWDWHWRYLNSDAAKEHRVIKLRKLCEVSSTGDIILNSEDAVFVANWGGFVYE